MISKQSRNRVAILVLVSCTTVMSGAELDSALTDLVAQRYDAAGSRLVSRLNRNPGDVDALYLLLATKQTRILDYESYAFEGDRFVSLADSVADVFRRSLPRRRGADSVRCLFYLGNTYGGISLILGKKGNLLSAARKALTSVAMLSRVQELNPSMWEAYLGTGIFKYYLSETLGWLPGTGARAAEGIREVRIATRAPFPYNLAARNSLCWILIEREHYGMADSVARTVLSTHPRNTIFLRIRAHVALKQGKLQRAEALARNLVDISGSRLPVNWCDLLSGYHVLLRCLDTKNVDSDRIVELCDRAESLKIPEKYRLISHVQDHLAYIRALRLRHSDSRIP
mgnify:CR=1 FL=1